MARKVLISFIGTGSLNKNDSAERIYKTANYKLGENVEKTSENIIRLLNISCI